MKIVCGLMVISLMAWGQDARPKEVHELIHLKYANPNQLRNLLTFYNISGTVSMQPDDQMHVLAVRGTPEAVAMVVAEVKKLDVEPAAFELTVYLLSSSPSDQLPDALAATAKQLHGVFTFKGYQLLESFALRGRDGQRGITQGNFLKDGKSSAYTFQYQQASVSGEAPKIVNLHNLDLKVQLNTGIFDKEGNPQGPYAGLHTDIDIRDGQKVVVGKSDVNSGGSPLIFVVTAKVVE